MQDLVADEGLAVAKESVAGIDLRSLSSSSDSWRGFDRDHMIVFREYLVIYAHDISMLSFTFGACQKQRQRHTMNFSVTSGDLLQEVNKSVLTLNVNFGFAIPVLSGELEPLDEQPSFSRQRG